MKLKSFSFKILLLVTAVYCTNLPAGSRESFGAFRNIRTKKVQMPFYREGRLEFFLRSESAALNGKLLDSRNPVIDIIRKNVKVETVAGSDSSSRIYSLDATLDEVNAYWQRRVYSEGVLVSENAALDQVSKIISSRDKVSLRTPVMDLDGIGYSADIVRQVIIINSRVQIVLRNDGKHSLGSPMDTASSKKKSAEVTVTRVYGDELVYYLAQNRIVLTGNVTVDDQAGTITADKLELRFVAAGNADKSGKLDGKNLTDSRKELQSARFSGRVYAERKLDAGAAAAGKQYARADMIFYDLKKDMLEMTGSRPRMGRGKDIAEADRIVINPDKKLISFHNNCFFLIRRENALPNTPPEEVRSDFASWDYPADQVHLVGNVKLKSRGEKADMQSDKLFVTLEDDATAGNKKEVSNITGDNSSKKIKKVIAAGKVRFDRNNRGIAESARAGKITYLAAGEELIFEDNPVLRRDGDVISGGKLTYVIPAERMIVKSGSNIVISAKTAGSGEGLTPALGGKKSDSKAPGGPINVTSNSSDLNYGGDMIGFAGKVQVRGRGMSLDCNTLDIFLKDTLNGKKIKADDPDAIAGSKQPVRALAIGNVRAEDASGILKSGLLDIYFGDKQNPGKTDIEKIIAANGMYVESKPRASGSGAGSLPDMSGSGKSTIAARRGVIDLIKNKTDFYEQVKVRDSAVALDCEFLQIITKRAVTAVPSVESYELKDEFPDRLAVGEDRELVRIIARDNVRMRRTTVDGEVQRAKSDLAVYTVKDRKVVMTSKPPRRPQAVTDGTGMVGDKVLIDLDEEEIIVENGDVLTRMDDMNF